MSVCSYIYIYIYIYINIDRGKKITIKLFVIWPICVLFSCRSVYFITSLFCALSVSLLRSYCFYPQPKKNNWRQKHEAFIQTMRQGQVHTPGSVPQPALNLNSEYVSCPHCGRKFAPGPSERHIPKCQNIRSRPPPPSSSRRKIPPWLVLQQLSVRRHVIGSTLE